MYSKDNNLTRTWNMIIKIHLKQRMTTAMSLKTAVRILTETIRIILESQITWVDILWLQCSKEGLLLESMLLKVLSRKVYYACTSGIIESLQKFIRIVAWAENTLIFKKAQVTQHIPAVGMQSSPKDYMIYQENK